MTPPTDPVVLYVLGAGHCGSTLLGLLLNGHDRMCVVGELDKLDRAPETLHSSDRRKLEGPFWSEVSACFRAASGVALADARSSTPSTRQLLRRDRGRLRRWSAHNDALLRCISACADAPVLVDISKRWQRLHMMRSRSTLTIKVVHLVRDGRAVLNSYRRKGRTFGESFRRWASPTLVGMLLRRRFAPADWLTIRYEDLAQDPEGQLRRVCGLLDVPFQDQMLHFRDHANVGLGGNRMRFGDDTGIELDERWRKELGPGDRGRFAVLGGWLNRLSGYPAG